VSKAFLSTNFANGGQTIKPFAHPTKLAEIGKVPQIIAMPAFALLPRQHSSLSRRLPKSLKLPGIGKFLLFPRGILFETIFL
jgi:hypothetical protein